MGFFSVKRGNQVGFLVHNGPQSVAYMGKAASFFFGYKGCFRWCIFHLLGVSLVQTGEVLVHLAGFLVHFGRFLILAESFFGTKQGVFGAKWEVLG